MPDAVIFLSLVWFLTFYRSLIDRLVSSCTFCPFVYLLAIFCYILNSIKVIKLTWFQWDWLLLNALQYILNRCTLICFIVLNPILLCILWSVAPLRLLVSSLWMFLQVYTIWFSYRWVFWWRALVQLTRSHKCDCNSGFAVHSLATFFTNHFIRLLQLCKQMSFALSSVSFKPHMWFEQGIGLVWGLIDVVAAYGRRKRERASYKAFFWAGEKKCCQGRFWQLLDIFFYPSRSDIEEILGNGSVTIWATAVL